jgi:hypothetical protein
LTGFENETRDQYLLGQAIATAPNFLSGLIWIAFFSLAYRYLVLEANQRDTDGGGKMSAGNKNFAMPSSLISET